MLTWKVQVCNDEVRQPGDPKCSSK